MVLSHRFRSNTRIRTNLRQSGKPLQLFPLQRVAEEAVKQPTGYTLNPGGWISFRLVRKTSGAETSVEGDRWRYIHR